MGGFCLLVELQRWRVCVCSLRSRLVSIATCNKEQKQEQHQEQGVKMDIVLFSKDIIVVPNQCIIFIGSNVLVVLWKNCNQQGQIHKLWNYNKWHSNTVNHAYFINMLLVKMLLQRSLCPVLYLIFIRGVLTEVSYFTHNENCATHIKPVNPLSPTPCFPLNPPSLPPPSPHSDADLDCGGEELVVVDCLGSVAADQDSEDSEDEGWYSLSRNHLLQ